MTSLLDEVRRARAGSRKMVQTGWAVHLAFPWLVDCTDEQGCGW